MKKLKLAFTPTPVETIIFNKRSFLIKRDDMTGLELSGNKVRKLEYLLAQAKKEKAEIIFTCGGIQSNHCRATAIASAKAGLKTRLFLWGKRSEKPEGNLFFDKFIGADIRYLDLKEYRRVNDIMFEERLKENKKGRCVYVIPEGGSTTYGVLGYSDFISELSTQIEIKKLKGILAAAGTGGTAAGLLVGSALLNLNLKIYAVNVLYEPELLRKKIFHLAEACLLEHKFNCKINYDNLVILDGYSREGYKNISTDKLRLIKDFAQSTGIILDPAYTGKAFYAYCENFLFNGKGRQVLFIHTGGLFGVFAKKEKYLSVIKQQVR